jgi:hypothetical protein
MEKLTKYLELHSQQVPELADFIAKLFISIVMLDLAQYEP